MTTTLPSSAVQSVTFASPNRADKSRIVSFLREALESSPRWAGLRSPLGEPDSDALIDFAIDREMAVLAKSDEQIVGMAGWRFRRSSISTSTPNCVELVLLFVRRDFRGQGIGQALCREYMRCCEQRQFGDPVINLPPDGSVLGLMQRLGLAERSRIFALPSA